MESNSSAKYDIGKCLQVPPFSARDEEVFKKAVHGVGIEFTVCFFKDFAMLQFNINIEIKFEYCFYIQTS